MKQLEFKLGFGPMSLRIIDIMCKYASGNKLPIMIIASRNQIDGDSGYVCTLDELNSIMARYDRTYIKLCRDHCGPYFLDSEKNLDYSQALEATKTTIQKDIDYNFDLIHIDTSRVDNAYATADILFNFSLAKKPNIEFEFGTEENVGKAAAKKKYIDDVEFAKHYNNVRFVVGQTGSLVMEDRQIGNFDILAVKGMVDHARKNSIGLKEHQADYLSNNEIKLRNTLGVHALNVAPQLGVIQTKTVLALADKYSINSFAFKDLVLKNNKWKKWHIHCNNEQKVIIAGHYHFRHNSYLDLEEQLGKLCNLDEEIDNAITDCLNRYFVSMYLAK